MRGTDFEFRHRFWFICLIFFLAFGFYFVQPANVIEWLLKTLGQAGREPSFILASMAAHVAFGASAFLVGLAALIRTWGTAYLKKEVVQDSAIHGDRLVADGPYRYVRNPLYLGNMLLALGFAAMAPPIGALVLVVGMGVVVTRLIGREEAFLQETQGEAFRAYLARVPRLWPALRPRLPASGAKPRWGQAWAGEFWMWMFFAGTAVFAFSLNGKFFDVFVWSGLALYFIFRIATRRGEENRPA